MVVLFLLLVQQLRVLSKDDIIFVSSIVDDVIAIKEIRDKYDLIAKISLYKHQEKSVPGVS